MNELTARQQEIYQWIRSHMERNGVPPTRAELCTAMGFRSPNAAEDHLKALARKGVIELMPGSARGIRLKEPLEAANDDPSLPLVGKVAAGSPILAAEHVESHVQLDPNMFRPNAHYLLRVQGMSMKDAGILDGDLLAVHQTRQAKNGQIVVARIDDEVTVKRFQQDGHQLQLLPENPDFKPILIDLRQQPVEIEGLAVGVIRNGMPH
jgi:repressor LexA